jgi:hypothetical protein
MEQEQKLEQALNKFNDATLEAINFLEGLVEAIKLQGTFKRELNKIMDFVGYEDPTGEDRDWSECAIEVFNKVDDRRTKLLIAKRAYLNALKK